VLSVEEARALLNTIDTNSPVGLRDRALIGLMIYTFARVGAAIKMRVKDVYVQGRRTWVRLHEKGGKRHEMPCHHNLDEYLQAYIEGAEIALGRKRLSVSHGARPHKAALRTSHASGGRLPHDPPPRRGCRGTHEDRLSQLRAQQE